MRTVKSIWTFMESQCSRGATAADSHALRAINLSPPACCPFAAAPWLFLGHSTTRCAFGTLQPVCPWPASLSMQILFSGHWRPRMAGSYRGRAMVPFGYGTHRTHGLQSLRFIRRSIRGLSYTRAQIDLWRVVHGPTLSS